MHPSKSLPESADSVLNQIWGGELPVDVLSIARRAGLKVYESHELSPAIARFDVRDTGPAITLAIDEPLVRKRYALAHALGHYLAAGEPKTFHVQDYAREGVPPAVHRANDFALALLVPRISVDFAISQAPSLERLAALFNVAPVALKFRLCQLGVL
jgi:Zn-dependent peptidase ImmA (M78 family)